MTSEADLLVVDDEQFLRNAVAASLRFLGFRVIATETGWKRCGWRVAAPSTWSSST
jgi:CheY-like chemotaxis protein